ncbi:MAG: GNAT family N-acetyltransferase [Defluviitaleaceae bacterium]|nr:GNAT family N-acetyltransferase [Defluviitaleaceae bacterium]
MRKIGHRDYFWQNDLVRLRWLQESDWEMFYVNRFDTPARLLVDYIVELPPTEKEAREVIETFTNPETIRKNTMLAIEDLEGNVVGAINLNSVNERNGTFSIGLQIDGQHRGKGYGTAAMKLMMKYAFEERRLNKYYGSVLDGNVASAAMLKKLGCQQEGVRRQMIYSGGMHHDEILFGLTRDDYEKLRQMALCY